jgi:hypothetical protein
MCQRQEKYGLVLLGEWVVSELPRKRLGQAQIGILDKVFRSVSSGWAIARCSPQSAPFPRLPLPKGVTAS